MNQLVVLTDIEIPRDWDYEESVAKMKPLVYKWKNLSLEVRNELWIAREILSKKVSKVFKNNTQDANALSVQNIYTWSGYCEAIGLHYTTVNRWLSIPAESWQGMLSSNSPDWYTPAEYVHSVRKVLKHIDLDPASCAAANKTVQAKEIYTKDVDGLKSSWNGKVFLNPPYGKEGPPFVEKLINEFRSQNVTEFILLVNSRATDAEWFQPLFDFLICFTDHRIEFDSPNKQASGSTHGSCFVYGGKNEKGFAREFSKHGTVLRKY